MRKRAGTILTATIVVMSFVLGATMGVAWAGFSGSDSDSGSVSTATLNAPTSLAATVAGGAVTLSWTATTSTIASGTRVFRGTASGGPYSQIAQITGLVTSTYVDNPGNGTFYYVVKSYYSGNGANWTSNDSNQAAATVQPIALVQSITGGGTATTFSATFASTPVSGDLLVAIASTRINGTMTTPSGWSVAISQTGATSPDQTIFYKRAGSAESKTVTIVTTATGNSNGLQLYEYTGVATLAQTGSSTGSSTAVGSGSITTTTGRALILAGLTSKSGTALSAWTNTFTARASFTKGTTPNLFGGADRFVSTTGTYTTTATSTLSGAWRGQIVAFT